MDDCGCQVDQCLDELEAVLDKYDFPMLMIIGILESLKLKIENESYHDELRRQ